VTCAEQAQDHRLIVLSPDDAAAQIEIFLQALRGHQADLDLSVLRPAMLFHLHSRHDLQSPDERLVQISGNDLFHLVKDAVDPEPHPDSRMLPDDEFVLADLDMRADAAEHPLHDIEERLDMDIRRA